MTPYRALIERTAAAHGLDADLVEAIVIAESNGYTDAFRHEPDFYRQYLAHNAEYAGLNPRRISSSYGLMQVMFTTAQHYGFQDHPELLFVPEIGLSYGCLHLAQLLRWATGEIRKAVAAYNGGQGNWHGEQPQRYATRVLKLSDAVRRTHAEAKAV